MVELTRKLGAKHGADVLALDRLAEEGIESLETDLDFDAVQRIGLEGGLVDNKSAAIDDDWQAVRFVFRKADRPR